MARMTIEPDLTDIARDFVVEAMEGLEALDSKFVELERDPSPELLADTFRVMHTIKGAAGFLSLGPIVAVAHAGEDVMGRLRAGEIAVDSAIVDAILETVDVLKALIDEVAAGEDHGVETEAVLGRLRAILAADAGAPERSESAESAPARVKAREPGRNAKAKAKAKAKRERPESTGTKGAARDCFSEDEFDALMRGARRDGGALADAGGGGTSRPKAVDDRDPFTEEEFDALLKETRAAAAGPYDAGKVPARGAAAPSGGCSKSARAGARKGDAAADQTIRIDIRRLDHVMNLVGELVLDRNRILKIASIFDDRSPDDDLVRSLRGCAEHLDLVSSDLQSAVMKTRMIPIGKVFGRFPRLIRDLARELGKEIQLEMHGEETELDKSLVEEVGDPLVHLIRNAVDHAIEHPEVREAAGKPRCGTIRLGAFHEGDSIVIEIKDDGKGIDAGVIRRKAVEKGLIDSATADRMSDRDVVNLIFVPGFSSAEAVSSVSGRGVGMDVVKTNITKLNGLIEIDTAVGKGTTVSLKLPLTLAIIRSLMVELARRTFAIPLGLITEIVRLDPNEVRTVDGVPVIYLRDSVIPLIPLKRVLDAEEGELRGRWIYAVVVGLAERRYGLIVDGLHGLEEVVIKSLGDVLPQDERIAGATILGDGRVVLILDVPGIVQGARAGHSAAA